MSVIEKQSKNIKGGVRKGAGRKAGVPNKKTAAVQHAVESSGITPLEYLLTVMRDPGGEPRERLNAAMGAAPYVHAKLANISVQAEHSGEVMFGWLPQ